jgi:hypothetical protein
MIEYYSQLCFFFINKSYYSKMLFWINDIEICITKNFNVFIIEKILCCLPFKEIWLLLLWIIMSFL